MHEHWCDVQRAIRCVQRDFDTLCLMDMDWETEDDESDTDEAPDEFDPAQTSPRVFELYVRAVNRAVRTPDLDGTS